MSSVCLHPTIKYRPVTLPISHDYYFQVSFIDSVIQKKRFPKAPSNCQRQVRKLGIYWHCTVESTGGSKYWLKEILHLVYLVKTNKKCLLGPVLEATGYGLILKLKVTWLRNKKHTSNNFRMMCLFFPQDIPWRPLCSLFYKVDYHIPRLKTRQIGQITCKIWKTIVVSPDTILDRWSTLDYNASNI